MFKIYKILGIFLTYCWKGDKIYSLVDLSTEKISSNLELNLNSISFFIIHSYKKRILK